MEACLALLAEHALHLGGALRVLPHAELEAIGRLIVGWHDASTMLVEGICE
jgi:hypothetical protein